MILCEELRNIMDNITINGDTNHNILIKQRMGWDVWVPEWEISCRCGMYTTVQDFKNRPLMLQDREEFVKKYGEAIFLSFNNSYLGNIESAVALGLSHLQDNGIIKNCENDLNDAHNTLTSIMNEYINNPCLDDIANSLKSAMNNYKNEYYIMTANKIDAPVMPTVTDEVKAEYYSIKDIR